jgi:hypothetical protein
VQEGQTLWEGRVSGCHGDVTAATPEREKCVRKQLYFQQASCKADQFGDFRHNETVTAHRARWINSPASTSAKVGLFRIYDLV